MDEEFLNAGEDDFETDSVDEEKESAQSEAEDASEPAEPTDHVVHVYEYGKHKRTIPREFTAEDAEAFASDFNRTAKPYGRFAVAAKAKARPKKSVPWPTFRGAVK